MKRSATLILCFCFPIVATAANNRQAVLQTLSRMIDTAYEIEHYALLHDRLPDAATPADLARELGNPAMEPFFVDAWGTELRIVIDPDAKTYSVISAGSDRAFAPATWSWPEDSTDPAADAVIRDGRVFRSALKWARPAGSEADILADALAWSKANRTIADVRTLATAIEAYGADHNAYPAADDLDALEKAIAPTYVTRMPRNDGWGTPLKYTSNGSKYQIVSAGADRQFDSASWTTRATTPDLSKDAVFANGEFIRMWQAGPASEFHQAWGAVVVALNKLGDLHSLTPEQRRSARVQGLLEESDRQFQRRSAAQNAFVTSFRLFVEAAAVDPDALGRDRLLRYASEFRRSSAAAAAPTQSGVRGPSEFYERSEGKEIGRALRPLLQRYVAAHPGDDAVLFALVDLTDTVESPAKAAEVLENEVKQRPSNAAAWIRLAQMSLASKQNEKALAAVDTAVTLPNITADQITDISAVYSQLGKRRRVLEIARKQVSANPDDPDTLYFLGKTAYEAAAHDTVSATEKRALLGEGETALRNALKRSPEHVESLAYLSLILRQRAALEPDVQAAKKLIDEADQLRDEARIILRSRQSS